MSRNKDRLGGGTTPDQDVPAAATNTNVDSNDGFSFVVPTDMVDLPSKGKFYAAEHPFYN